MQKTWDRPLKPTGSHVKSPKHLSMLWENAQLMRIDEVYADQVYEEPEYIQILDSVPSVKIRFHAVSITSKRMKYNYILEGHDEDWIETWDEETRYENLPIGEYTFRVIAANDAPVYSEKPAEMKLSVVPDPRDQVISELEKKVRARTKELTKSNEELQTEIKKRRHAEEGLQHQLELQKKAAKELEERTEELSRTNQELDAFVYTVSHDLKAPLVSLNGFSQLLIQECEGQIGENGAMYVERIGKNSQRMENLINDLLELSRIGRIKGKEEMVSIGEVISESADEFAIQLEEKKTKLVVKDEMPTIFCDRMRMSQVFTNLMSNANKFMGEDNSSPTIELGYKDQSSCHTFYVKDNGIGIDKEYHEKIFQSFQRLDDVKTEGSGIGLSIVKKIVEGFGGRIWVESEKGKGATMYFTLPK